MKINWHQNPFLTTVELDERDKERILIAYQNEEYSNILCDLNLELNGKYNRPALTDLEVIKEKVGKWGEICNLKADSEEIQSYMKELEYPHMGDCTCVPCSCMRCFVENMLGIDTIEGLGKHEANKMWGAFGKDGTTAIDEAIMVLEEPYRYEERHEGYKDYPEESYMALAVRWNKERKSAAEWLKKYKEEHNF
jgi:hypothetical protein